VFGRSGVIDRLTFGRLRQLIALQWHVIART
jgi:hypothetical protein